MSKEEFLKIQTCVLKVNIHCEGCKHNVKKILQKIDGVYTTTIDSEQGKVTVSGNVDPGTLIKKLSKKGKHAEIWGAPKANNSNQLNNQFKNLQIDNGKSGNNKGQQVQVQKGGNNQPKGGPQGGQNPQLQQLKQLQQLQQLQQLKGFQDLKMPPQFMKDLKTPVIAKDQNPKSGKFNGLEDDDMMDDELDEFDDEDDYDDEDYDEDDDEFDDEIKDMPLNKTKLGNGLGGAPMPNMMSGQYPLLMKGGANGGGNGGNAGGNGKIGGGGNVPVMVNVGGNGNNTGSNQNQGGGKNGGGQPQANKGGGGGGGGGQMKNGNNGGGANGHNMNAAKKVVGMSDGPQGMPNMMAMNAVGSMGQMRTAPMGQTGQMPMGQMGHMPMGQMSQMGNPAAFRGLPAPAMNGGGAVNFQGVAPEQMATNPHYQQQLAAMMMNQRHSNGNERFQPMMYARPEPAVNYMPPYPSYPYPPPPPGERVEEYSTFNDENSSSCTVM